MSGTKDKSGTKKVRLNKCIADSGLCSRREADRWIEAGRVQVNGRLAKTMGRTVDPEKDTVMVDGKPLPRRRMLYIAFHKPKDTLTTRKDPEKRRTIYDWLPERLHHLDPAGRLDRNTSGLLLLSNDGEFIQHVAHPGFLVEKVYRVTVSPEILDPRKFVQTMLNGIPLEPEGVSAQAVSVSVLSPNEVELVLVTGYNRQIRRMMEGVGLDVKQLRRIAFGPVTLGRLAPGKTRDLTLNELRKLSPSKESPKQNPKSSPPKKGRRNRAGKPSIGGPKTTLQKVASRSSSNSSPKRSSSSRTSGGRPGKPSQKPKK